jgi:hypothetical protein
LSGLSGTRAHLLAGLTLALTGLTALAGSGLSLTAYAITKAARERFHLMTELVYAVQSLLLPLLLAAAARGLLGLVQLVA